MQATSVTGLVLKRELNRVKKEKSKEHSLFPSCFRIPPTLS